MDLNQMNKLRVAAFSPLTVLKDYRKSLLEEAIRNNPVTFVKYATEYKLSPQQQMDLMIFFLDLAIVNNRIVETYRFHLNLFLNNLTYTWLWPTSVSLFRTSLTPFGITFVDPASYY